MATPTSFVAWVDRALETPPKLAFGYCITFAQLVTRPAYVFEQRQNHLESNLTLPPATFYAVSYGLFLATTYWAFVIALDQAPVPVLKTYFGQMETFLRAMDFTRAVLLSLPFVSFLALSAAMQRLALFLGGARVSLSDLLHANFYVQGMALVVCGAFWAGTALYHMAVPEPPATDAAIDPVSSILLLFATLLLIASCLVVASTFHRMVLRDVRSNFLSDFAILVVNAAMPVFAIVGVTLLFSKAASS